MQSAFEEYAKLEERGLDRTRTAIDEIAKLWKDSLGYSSQLASEWRRRARALDRGRRGGSARRARHGRIWSSRGHDVPHRAPARLSPDAFRLRRRTFPPQGTPSALDQSGTVNDRRPKPPGKESQVSNDLHLHDAPHELLVRGDFDGPESLYRMTLERAERVGQMHSVAWCWGQLSWIAVMSGAK